jgi:hypothetical protein
LFTERNKIRGKKKSMIQTFFGITEVFPDVPKMMMIIRHTFECLAQVSLLVQVCLHLRLSCQPDTVMQCTVIPAVRGLRQENHELQAILGMI